MGATIVLLGPKKEGKRKYITEDIDSNVFSVASARSLEDMPSMTKITITDMNFINHGELAEFRDIVKKIIHLHDICTFFTKLKGVEEFNLTFEMINNDTTMFRHPNEKREPGTNGKKVSNIYIKSFKSSSYERVVIVKNDALFSRHEVDIFNAVRKRNCWHREIIPLSSRHIHINKDILVLITDSY